MCKSLYLTLRMVHHSCTVCAEKVSARSLHESKGTAYTRRQPLKGTILRGRSRLATLTTALTVTALRLLPNYIETHTSLPLVLTELIPTQRLW